MTQTTTIIEELTALYTEPHRKYHSLSHIARLLELGAPLGLMRVQRWAIWFHDAIYEIGAKDNEARSADLAVELLKRHEVGLADEELENIHRIILDTVEHQPSIPESELVLDLDLSMFAEPWEDYARMVALVRQEYPMATDEQWCEGRSAFLREFAKRDPFFFTPHFKEHTVRALENIERELEEMG